MGQEKEIGQKSHYALFLTTCSTEREAQLIATVLLNERLVACVNIIGKVHSHYWWKGKITHNKEWLLFMKSHTGLQHSIEEALKKNHSYSLPELIRIDIAGGLPKYLNWIDATLKGIEA